MSASEAGVWGADPHVPSSGRVQIRTQNSATPHRQKREAISPPPSPATGTGDPDAPTRTATDPHARLTPPEKKGCGRRRPERLSAAEAATCRCKGAATASKGEAVAQQIDECDSRLMPWGLAGPDLGRSTTVIVLVEVGS